MGSCNASGVRLMMMKKKKKKKISHSWCKRSHNTPLTPLLGDCGPFMPMLSLRLWTGRHHAMLQRHADCTLMT